MSVFYDSAGISSVRPVICFKNQYKPAASSFPWKLIAEMYKIVLPDAAYRKKAFLHPFRIPLSDLCGKWRENVI